MLGGQPPVRPHEIGEDPDLASQTPTQSISDELTAEGRIVGTVPYMSPEQLEGKEIDERSDIFSLGVVLFEMATGRRPFQGDTSVSLIMSIGRDTPPDVDSLRGELPHHLGRVIARCLEKDPEKRYQTAKGRPQRDGRLAARNRRQHFGTRPLSWMRTRTPLPRLCLPLGYLSRPETALTDRRGVSGPRELRF